MEYSNLKFSVGDKVIYEGIETEIAAISNYCKNTQHKDFIYVVKYESGLTPISFGHRAEHIVYGNMLNDQKYHISNENKLTLIAKKEEIINNYDIF